MILRTADDGLWVDPGRYLPNYEVDPVIRFEPSPDAGPRFCRSLAPFTRSTPPHSTVVARSPHLFDCEDRRRT
jgi:hypothetical protein